MITITSNAVQIGAELARLAGRQVPFGVSFGLNQTARGVIQTHRQSMQQLFDRPVPETINGLKLTQLATKERLQATLDFDRRFGRGWGDAITNALTPHIPGYPATRQAKSSEDKLRAQGWLAADEFLMPSRTYPLDTHGNVYGPAMQKMLADIGAYRNMEGFTHTTYDARARYMFGTVSGRSGRPVTGIWKVQGGRRNYITGRWWLMMLAIKRPTYRKRYDYPEITERYVDQHLANDITAGILHAIATRR